ncbi:MAG: hypothetical protein WCJ33_02255 [Pseudomonadota bacterium]
MLTNVRYVILTALRDWLFTILILGVVIVTMIAKFLGGTALIENKEMTLVFASGAVRILIVIGILIFSCFHVRNAFDTKEIDLFLSRPLTRANLVFSYWLGFAAVSLLLVIPSILLVAVNGIIAWKGFAFWAVNLMIECLLVIAISILFSFTLRSAVTSVIASSVFYIVSRMIGFFIAISEENINLIGKLASQVIKLFSYFVPRLDLFARSDLLVYGVSDIQDLQMVVFQIIIFIPVIIFITVLNFNRKQF